MTKLLDEELRRLNSDLSRNYLFLSLEQKIRNPVSTRSRPRSETLLSAYVVLSCGRFERFLKQMFYLAAQDLRDRIGSPTDARIPKPDAFLWNNINGFVSWAARAKGVSHSNMISLVEDFAASVQGGLIHPASFQRTDANPNTETVRAMFSRFGVEGCMPKLESVYLDAQGRRLPRQLIEDKLNEFVKRRHEAAHHGRIPNVTRADVADDHVFIAALCAAINQVLKAHLALI
jgi:hypothetical protein